MKELAELENSGDSTMLQYRRMRAPSQHLGSLQSPSLAETRLNPLSGEQVVSIQDTIQTTGFDFARQSKAARQELLQLATEYSSRYRDVDTPTHPHRVVMSGHQPALFHPGVWYKNFSLSRLGERLGATPVNLIIDTDLCTHAWVKAPVHLQTDGVSSATVQTIPFDAIGPPVPFESRPIRDRDVFCTFASRAQERIQSIVQRPLVLELWKHVDPQRHGNLLGLTTAAARHALEGEHGLQTLELPISSVAQTESFGLFFLEIAQRIDSFHEAYNQNLQAYRKIHRIRSNAHPVPELTDSEGWWEAPFWIWTNEEPRRRPLYLKNLDSEIELTDKAKVRFRFSKSNFVGQWLDWNRTSGAIRTRALTTTLYSRLMLSDLFLHGIGGAKYDQLTDAIAKQFFQVRLPSFSTLTATLKLPVSSPDVSNADLSRLTSQKRDLLFHPETHISEWTPELQDAADSKKKWIATDLPQKQRKPRHDGIESANETLRKAVAADVQSLESETDRLSALVRDAEILHSREYSFCLFPETLIDDLRSLA